MGHQHLVCSLHLAGPVRVAFLGDIEVIHATAVVAEVAQYLSNFLTASPLSQQISECIYHFADTIGIVSNNMALGLKPFWYWPVTTQVPWPRSTGEDFLFLSIAYKFIKAVFLKCRDRPCAINEIVIESTTNGRIREILVMGSQEISKLGVRDR